MPIQFKASPNGTDPFKKMQTKVREGLGLPPEAHVHVSMTQTFIRHAGVECTVPLGIKDIQKSDNFDSLRGKLAFMFGAPVQASEPTFTATAETPVQSEQPVKPYNDMADEEWVQAVAKQLFPGILPLSKATGLHQPVTGTGSGSVYKTCFMGPELKVAGRIKGGTISFRITTDKSEAPKGQVRAICERLGATNVYDDRITLHCQMSGPYDGETAGEYRALFGAFYAALRPWINTPFPAIAKLTEGVK